jgi:hypothetical protein
MHWKACLAQKTAVLQGFRRSADRLAARKTPLFFACFKTLFTVFLEAPQLYAMFC